MDPLLITDRMMIYLAVVWTLILGTVVVTKTPAPAETAALESRVMKLEQRCDEAFTGATP